QEVVDRHGASSAVSTTRHRGQDKIFDSHCPHATPTREQPRVRWHTLALLCSCRGPAVKDDAPPPRPTDAAIDAAVDASTIDAMQFALFDHLAVRQIKYIPGAKPPALAKHKPTLPAKLDAVDVAAMPPWLQNHIG